MKYRATFFFVIILFATCWSQNLPGVGAKWTYGAGHAITSGVGYSEWIVEKDTVLNGVIHRKFVNLPYTVSMLYEFYLSEFGDTVNLYTPDRFFNVLYNWSAQPGDFWYTKTGDCDFKVTVDSIGTDTINGIFLKSMILSSDNYFLSGKVIQKLGRVEGISPEFFYDCTGGFSDGFFSTGLRCFEEPEIGFVKFDTLVDCNLWTLGTADILDHNRLLVFPNPAVDVIKIENAVNGDEFAIINMMGKILLSVKYAEGINLSSLPAGTYLIKYKESHSIVMKK